MEALNLVKSEISFQRLGDSSYLEHLKSTVEFGVALIQTFFYICFFDYLLITSSYPSIRTSRPTEGQKRIIVGIFCGFLLNSFERTLLKGQINSCSLPKDVHDQIITDLLELRPLKIGGSFVKCIQNTNAFGGEESTLLL